MKERKIPHFFGCSFSLLIFLKIALHFDELIKDEKYLE
jgi:hypothetical protein